jgi:hypothetical protein
MPLPALSFLLEDSLCLALTVSEGKGAHGDQNGGDVEQIKMFAARNDIFDFQ